MRKTKHYALNKDKFLSKSEEQLLIESISNASLRDSLLIKTALWTGARANELLSIRVKDLEPSTMEVFVFGSKGSNDRAIPMPKILFDQLNAFAVSQCDELVFDICYQRLDQVWNKYRPNGKTFHSLRHTCAIRLFERTQNLQLVKTVLGHRCISNTMIYAEYFYSTQEMRKFMVAE